MNDLSRDEFVKAARTYALAYGRHDDAPSYLPRTDEDAATFQPHAWVIGALMHAYMDGVADGRGNERQDMQAGRMWIPVSLQMPEQFTEVLICFRGAALPATGQFTGNLRDSPDGWSYPSENGGDDTDWTVTHWMPLPKHPEAERFETKAAA